MGAEHKSVSSRTTGGGGLASISAGQTSKRLKPSIKAHTYRSSDGHTAVSNVSARTRLREQPVITRDKYRDRGSTTLGIARHGGGSFAPRYTYGADVHLARYHWLHSLHRRHRSSWDFSIGLGFGFDFGWGDLYIGSRYGYPYQPYIGRWHGYPGWYRCTPYVSGLWYPWHRRAMLGYVYSPYRYDVPYTTTLWANYDPFIYSWWPAPYSISINYFTSEKNNYPDDASLTDGYTGWVKNEPEEVPDYIPPAIANVYVPPAVWNEKSESSPVETAQPAPVRQSVPTPPVSSPAGTVEAATLPESQSVETDLNVPTMPLDQQTLESVSTVQSSPSARPSSEPPISVAAPGKSQSARTVMAVSGMAFLGAALWMARPW